MTARMFFLHVLGVALGTLGGVVLSQSLLESRLERMLDDKLAEQLLHVRALAAQRVVTPPAVTVPDHREELREIRAQLAALAASGARVEASSPASSAEPEARPEAPPPTPPQELASRQAQEILDAALARGRWSEEDESRFQQALHQAPPGRLEELSSRLSKAINSGQLRPVFMTGY